jgi:hypothetical protein
LLFVAQNFLDVNDLMFQFSVLLALPFKLKNKVSRCVGRSYRQNIRRIFHSRTPKAEIKAGVVTSGSW